MRIIAGRLRGRRLIAPKGETTRPTTDRVRESVFSTLTSLSGSDLGGGPTVDAFAGSGALGLEAISRGAGPVTFIENDRRALAALKANLESLSVGGESRVLHGDAFALAGRGVGGPFSLILLDPPYTLDAARVGSFLQNLADNCCVAPGAFVTWEHAANTEVVWPQGFVEVTEKRYGTIGVSIACHEEG